MIAFAKPAKRTLTRHVCQRRFLAMLPAIRRTAEIAFRKIHLELRGELIAEVIANSFVAYVRLVQRRKEHLAFPSALARYAVAQVRVGRKVGSRLSSRDALSGYAQRQKGFHVERLDHFDPEEESWREVVVEDRRATPAEIACCRIDFSNWLRLLPRRQQKIALTLAGGETTKGAAKKHGLCPARISQLRLLLKESWERFQGELFESKPSRLAAAA